MDRRQIKEDYGDEPIIFINKTYDKAIIGVAHTSDKNIVCYDSEKCIQIIMEKQEFSYDQASSYFNESIENKEYGQYRPLFINT